MLAAGLALCLQAEEIGQGANNWVEHRNARHLQSSAAILKLGAQAFINHGKEHHAWMGANRRQHLLDLARGPHQGPGMLNDLDALELDETSPRQCVDGLARRVGDKVKVKFLAHANNSSPFVEKTIGWAHRAEILLHSPLFDSRTIPCGQRFPQFQRTIPPLAAFFEFSPVSPLSKPKLQHPYSSRSANAPHTHPSRSC
jgi:hypothetical protein